MCCVLVLVVFIVLALPPRNNIIIVTKLQTSPTHRTPHTKLKIIRAHHEIRRLPYAIFVRRKGGTIIMPP